MADNIDELETIRISELDTASVVDKNHDYLVISHPTTMALDNWQTLKATPAQVMADAGLAYTAGEHINISSSNVISASFDNATTEADGLMSAADKSKLAGIADNANNYTLPVADANTLGGVKAGTGVTIANDGTISAQGQTYSAGTNIQISNANVISATDTTYSDATTEASGLMSYADKIKLNGIADSANNYSLPIADANTLGGVKQGSNISIASDGTISATNLGNAVVANPASQSTATLTKLSVDGTVYEVSSGGSGTASISTLTDVTLSSLSDGQILTYDSATSKWINSNNSGGGTTVVANPAGAATQALAKLQVGSSIYSVLTESTIQTITLLAANWNSSTHLITVNVTGVTATSNQEILPLEATSSANISNNTALQSANIMDAGQASGTITLYAENVPSTDLQIRVIVRI